MQTRHIATMLAPAWGHSASYLYLATQLLQKDPTLRITVVQHNLLVAQMMAELKTLTHDPERLRIIGVGEKNLGFGPAMLKESLDQLFAGWLEIIRRMAQGSQGWPKPQAIHLDFFGGGFVVEGTKQLVGRECKILVWYSSSLAAMPAYLTDYDFAAISQKIYSDELRRQGRCLDEILEQVRTAWNGSDRLSGVIIKCPGVPDMYDHERSAYGAATCPGLGPLVVSAQKLAKIVDGIICPTARCLEPTGVPYCKEFYQKRRQVLFTVGVQAHASCWTDGAPGKPTNEVVRSFLDGAAAKYGPRSVLYISFGSLWFPTAKPQLIEALVDTLLRLEQPFPFIFALGSKMASLPKELIERVRVSNKGIVCDFWVEQRAILQHGAVGWFLTHGGFNSISESLSQGIPLIFWPTDAEQPVNAALLSTGPNPVGFELLQIRMGPQLAPALRGGPEITGTVQDASEEFQAVFDAARGSVGAILRKNAARMARSLKEARAGEISEELIRLASF